jgi:hypothetical protein
MGVCWRLLSFNKVLQPYLMLEAFFLFLLLALGPLPFSLSLFASSLSLQSAPFLLGILLRWRRGKPGLLRDGRRRGWRWLWRSE